MRMVPQSVVLYLLLNLGLKDIASEARTQTLGNRSNRESFSEYTMKLNLHTGLS